MSVGSVIEDDLGVFRLIRLLRVLRLTSSLGQVANKSVIIEIITTMSL